MCQLALQLVLRVQLCDRARKEQMTSRDEIKTALSARLKSLHTLGQAGGDGIAAVMSVGGTDEVHSLPQNFHLTALVSDALERAGNETYGLCAACEQRISPKRLAALPWAKYCISCQEVQEGFTAEVHWNSAA
jgi:RNA polymerase-binding transcription factor DksA